MNKIIMPVLLSTVMMANVVYAETFEWYDSLCDFKGEYDDRKYTEAQIKNSHYVLDHLTSVNLTSYSSPSNPKNLDNLSWRDMDKLNEEYKQYKSKIQKLDVVPEAKAYKSELLKDIEGEYVQDKLSLLAYLDPKKALKLSPPVCKQYIEPFFKGEQAVQDKWKQVVLDDIKEQERLGNHSFRKLHLNNYYHEKETNPSDYARIKLLTYGFGNCVNSQVYHADAQQVYNNYQKLNKILFGDSITEECDMP